MSTHADIVAGNNASRERLKALVARLTDEELGRDLGDGWTVASMLAHLGFYDARVLALFRRWRESGEVGPSALDPDVINQAKQPYFDLLPVRAAAALTVQLAEACDAAVAALTEEEMARMAAAGSPARLDRAHHREEHVEQIEAVVGSNEANRR